MRGVFSSGRAWIVVMVFFLLAVTDASSQTVTGAIRGIVRDTSDAVLPSVSITVRNVDTGITRNALTNETGNYNVPFLAPGNYDVTAELPGFRKEVRSIVRVEVNQQLLINFVLSVGQVTESVKVEATAITVETETASIHKTVDEKKVVELPLNGRNFLELNLLVPGVAPPLKGTQLQTQGGAINANGLREASNFFWLDGMDNTTSLIGQYVVKPSIDTVKEFKVESSSYSAEFGRTAGAQMNVLTKSGTNQFHGDAYEFVRNDIFDARNFFSDKKPPLRRNQFGGTVGGPILKERTFFFASYEGQRNRETIVRRVRVPDPRWIQGDFSNLLPATVIRDPRTGTPFSGNIIRRDQMDPIGAGLAAFYPAPNVNDVLNYLSSANIQDEFNQAFGRIDHKFSDRDTMFGRYNLDNVHSIQPINLFATETQLPGWGREQNNRFQVLGLSETHVFGPTAVNEFRAAYNRWKLGYLQQDHGSDIGIRLGIGGLSRDPRDMGFPVVRVTGFEPMGSSTNLPQGGPYSTYTIFDTVSLTRRGHALRFGGDYHYVTGAFFLNSTPRGLFSFTGQYSGQPVADLLLGVPLSAQRGLGSTDVLQTQKTISFFFQDDWKMRPGFTLNFGMRYEYNDPSREKRGRFTNFDFEKGTIFTSENGGVRPDENNFGPRVGFAWTPFNTAKTSIRGGYGIFYDISIGNVAFNLRINPPLFGILTATSDSSRPTINIANVFTQPPGQQPPPSINAMNRDFRDGFAQKWSLNVQHQLRPDLLVDVGYLGTKGTRLTWQVNKNQPLPGPGVVNARRTYQGYANINLWDSNGDSNYHSLQASVEKRFTAGLSFLASYTFSKSIDLTSTYFNSVGASNRAQDNNNLRAERGLSDFDVRNRFVFSYNYELPWGKGRKLLSDLSPLTNAFLGGWQVNGITAIQSGTPFTARLSADRTNTGQSFDRPNLVGQWKLDNPKPERWFNTSAFVIPPQFTFGNAGRGVLIGPGTVNFDFSLFKNFNFAEERRLQFRSEFFNIFNHANFDLPNRLADTPQFGRIFSASDGRRVQFALKYIF